MSAYDRQDMIKVPTLDQVSVLEKQNAMRGVLGANQTIAQSQIERSPAELAQFIQMIKGNQDILGTRIDQLGIRLEPLSDMTKVQPPVCCEEEAKTIVGKILGGIVHAQRQVINRLEIIDSCLEV